MQALTSVFTGRGGTIRLIVTGLVVLGVLDIAAEYNYQINGTYKKDSLFSFKPVGTSAENTEAGNINAVQKTEKPAAEE